MTQPTLDAVISAYLCLRGMKDEMAKRHKEEIAPLNEKLRQCQVWVQKQLQEQGQTNTRTDSGTAYLQTDVSVTTKDWPAILSWIQANNLWEFLEQRVSKSVVTEYIEHTKTIPPGIKYATETSCHIRRS